MKKYRLILLMFLGTVIIACQADSDDLLPETEENLVVHSDTMRGGAGSGGSGNNVPEDLERSLKWTAYLSGIAFYHMDYQTTRSDFNALMYPSQMPGSGTDTFTLEELIGPNPVSQSFKDSFMDALSYFIIAQLNTVPINPTFGDEEPEPPLVPEGDGIVNQGTLTQDYLDYVLEENCIEIYFPNGLDFGSFPNLATVAHPLKDSYASWGIRRTGLAVNNNQYVNPNYTFIHKNVLVARPVDSGYEGPETCDYSEYFTSVPIFNDFTVFLNGYGAY